MRIQASILGYRGQPATIIGVLDEQTNVLVIARNMPYSAVKIKEDLTLISNQALASRDAKFEDENLSVAIRAYEDRKSAGRLDIVGELQRFDPASKLESKDITEAGRSFVLNPDIDNGCMAVLALCYYADRLNGINASIADAQELSDFYFSI